MFKLIMTYLIFGVLKSDAKMLKTQTTSMHNLFWVMQTELSKLQNT